MDNMYISKFKQQKKQSIQTNSDNKSYLLKQPIEDKIEISSSDDTQEEKSNLKAWLIGIGGVAVAATIGILAFRKGEGSKVVEETTKRINEKAEPAKDDIAAFMKEKFKSLFEKDLDDKTIEKIIEKEKNTNLNEEIERDGFYNIFHRMFNNANKDKEFVEAENYLKLAYETGVDKKKNWVISDLEKLYSANPESKFVHTKWFDGIIENKIQLEIKNGLEVDLDKNIVKELKSQIDNYNHSVKEDHQKYAYEYFAEYFNGKYESKDEHLLELFDNLLATKPLKPKGIEQCLAAKYNIEERLIKTNTLSFKVQRLESNLNVIKDKLKNLYETHPKMQFINKESMAEKIKTRDIEIAKKTALKAKEQFNKDKEHIEIGIKNFISKELGEEFLKLDDDVIKAIMRKEDKEHMRYSSSPNILGDLISRTERLLETAKYEVIEGDYKKVELTAEEIKKHRKSVIKEFKNSNDINKLKTFLSTTFDEMALKTDNPTKKELYHYMSYNSKYSNKEDALTSYAYEHLADIENLYKRSPEESFNYRSWLNKEFDKVSNDILGHKLDIETNAKKAIATELHMAEKRKLINVWERSNVIAGELVKVSAIYERQGNLPKAENAMKEACNMLVKEGKFVKANETLQKMKEFYSRFKTYDSNFKKHIESKTQEVEQAIKKTQQYIDSLTADKPMQELQAQIFEDVSANVVKNKYVDNYVESASKKARNKIKEEIAFNRYKAKPEDIKEAEVDSFLTRKAEDKFFNLSKKELDSLSKKRKEEIFASKRPVIEVNDMISGYSVEATNEKLMTNLYQYLEKKQAGITDAKELEAANSLKVYLLNRLVYISKEAKSPTRTELWESKLDKQIEIALAPKKLGKMDKEKVVDAVKNQPYHANPKEFINWAIAS